jgi:CheY-like chemotaxis protein
VQFLRDDVTGAVNYLNNRLNAILQSARSISRKSVPVENIQDLENIDADIERATEVTQRLLHRVDGLAPEQAPSLAKQLAVHPVRTALILVVEDDDSNRSVITRLFQRLGYQVTPARNGYEAFEALQLHEPDCIVSDIRMPGLGGKSFYEQLEADQPHLCRRFVFVTGDYANPETRAFLDKTGNPAIAKPYDVRDLLAAVAHVLPQEPKQKKR